MEHILDLWFAVLLRLPRNKLIKKRYETYRASADNMAAALLDTHSWDQFSAVARIFLDQTVVTLAIRRLLLDDWRAAKLDEYRKALAKNNDEVISCIEREVGDQLSR